MQEMQKNGTQYADQAYGVEEGVRVTSDALLFTTLPPFVGEHTRHSQPFTEQQRVRAHDGEDALGIWVEGRRRAQ